MELFVSWVSGAKFQRWKESKTLWARKAAYRDSQDHLAEVIRSNFPMCRPVKVLAMQHAPALKEKDS